MSVMRYIEPAGLVPFTALAEDVMNRMICVSTEIPEAMRDGVLTLAHQSDLSFADALKQVIQTGLENLQRNLRSTVAEPRLADPSASKPTTT
jgi:hypothetical protein